MKVHLLEGALEHGKQVLFQVLVVWYFSLGLFLLLDLLLFLVSVLYSLDLGSSVMLEWFYDFCEIIYVFEIFEELHLGDEAAGVSDLLAQATEDFCIVWGCEVDLVG